MRYVIIIVMIVGQIIKANAITVQKSIEILIITVFVKINILKILLNYVKIVIINVLHVLLMKQIV